MTSFLIWSAMLFVIPAFSQEVKQNENGEMIVVNPDGSWYYLQPTGSSSENDPFAEDGRSNGPEMKAMLTKEEREQEEIEQKRMDLITLGDGLFQQHDQLAQEYNRVKQNRIDLVDRYKQLKKMKSEDLDETGEELFLEEIEEARDEEEFARNRVSKTKEIADFVEQMLQMSDRKMMSTFGELEQKMVAWQHFLAEERAPKYVKIKEVGPKNAKPKVGAPPVLSPDCEFAFEGVDEFTGKSRKDLVTRPFFTHTRDELKPYFKDGDYITCNGYMTKMTGNLIFLTLEFTIASPDAKYAFGGLDKGSILSVRLLNEEYVRLVNTKSDSGILDPLNNYTTYRAQYQLTDYQIRELEESEVDQVRVVWRTGYEDYEVFELDFFMNQFKCLK